ncbi:DUF1330 domain-containing protein [Rhodopila sp.]|uniref:DUF1330 domain-containing protein n=1 Tax=Rhodopila sp. TaxID=2480087 RepID=UPI003D0CBB17
MVFEFPTIDAIHRFWSSPEYAEVKKLRAGRAEVDLWSVPVSQTPPLDSRLALASIGR